MLTNENVLDLFKRQDDSMVRLEQNLKQFVEGSVSLSHANLINELGPIKNHLSEISQQNEIRNGRLDKAEDDICVLKNETRFGRFLQKHPIPTVLITIVIFMALAYGYHKLNFAKTIENTTGIVIEELDKR